MAHALAGLPLVTEQFGAGRLSYSQVRALCRVADTTNEGELVELAQEMNADQLERMCRLLRGLDDATDAEVPDLNVVHRVDGRRTAVEILTSLCSYHHRAHHRGRVAGHGVGADAADRGGCQPGS